MILKVPFTLVVSQTMQNPPEMQKTWIRSLGWEDPLKEDMATRSSILAARIPMVEKPGRLHPMGCKELDTTDK